MSSRRDASYWLSWIVLPLLGLATGFLVAKGGGALLGAVAGGILGWAIRKGAILAALRGGVIGGGFALLIGPGGDWLISGTPLGEKVIVALVVGILIGALLGVRNYRPRKKSSSPQPENI